MQFNNNVPERQKTPIQQQRRNPQGLAAVIHSNRLLLNRIAAWQTNLLTQAEALDQRTIRINIGTLEIVQQFATAAHHTQQTAARVVILDVFFEVTSQVIDAGGQQGHLNFCRTGIASSALIIGHDLRFLRDGNRYVKLSFVKSDAAPV